MKKPKLKYQYGSFLPFAYRPETLRRTRKFIEENPDETDEIISQITASPKEGLINLYDLALREAWEKGRERENRQVRGDAYGPVPEKYVSNYEPMDDDEFEDYLDSTEEASYPRDKEGRYIPVVGRPTFDPYMQEVYDYHQAWLNSPMAAEVAENSFVPQDLQPMHNRLSNVRTIFTPKRFASITKEGDLEGVVSGFQQTGIMPLHVTDLNIKDPKRKGVSYMGNMRELANSLAAVGDKEIAGIVTTKPVYAHELAHGYYLQNRDDWLKRDYDQNAESLLMTMMYAPVDMTDLKMKEGPYLFEAEEVQARNAEVRKLIHDNPEIFGIDVFTQPVTEDAILKLKQLTEDYLRGKPMRDVSEKLMHELDNNSNLIKYINKMPTENHVYLQNNLVRNNRKTSDGRVYAKKGGTLKPKIKY